ncbi:MAG: ZIP family metal transporter [Burkholderiaceae bacterium]|nr:ZIP family metal transporter [Burkholderiaceae bacterium]
MNTLVQTVAASTLAGFASMFIAFFFTSRLSHVWLTRIVSFAAGMMLALALLDLLPEALEGGMASDDLFLMLLITLIALFALDHKLHAGCRHGADGVCAHDLARPVPMILAGGALHVFTDGLMLGATFLVDPMLAWGMTFAVLAHEVPREAGDFALLLTAQWSRKKALIWNALSRLACVLGAVAGYLALSGAREWLPFILVIAAANFIYIALTGILPWLRQERETFAWQGGFMITGASLVYMITTFLE